YAAADEHIAATTKHWRRVAATSGMEPLFDECIDWLFSSEVIANRSDVNQLKTFYRLTLQEPAAFIAQSLAGVEHDSRRWLAGLLPPTLVLQGRADRLVRPHHAAARVQAIPNSHVAIVVEGAHVSNR